jgi:SAM-dependent methyltransferase
MLPWRIQVSRSLRKITRGYFDVVEPEGDALRVVGWMFRLDGPFDEFELRIDGRAAARHLAIELERITEAFPWIPHAGRSGFSFLHRPDLDRGTIEVVGLRKGEPAGRLRTIFSARGNGSAPVPPPELMKRVSGSDNPDFFRADGRRTFADFAAAVDRNGGFGRVRRMLDWGCGSGRVTAHFLADGRVPEVHGVDIDGEATTWCAQAFPAGHFQESAPYPPLPFPDGFFDLVVAYSVFTHLERGVQKTWLAEMKRVLAPGGLLLATVHGEFAALFAFPNRATPGPLGRIGEWLGLRSIISKEIVDSTRDHALDGVAPTDYYRGVYQRKDYTVREWSRFLDVIEYSEAGVGNFQDLVALRKVSS